MVNSDYNTKSGKFKSQNPFREPVWIDVETNEDKNKLARFNTKAGFNDPGGRHRA